MRYKNKKLKFQINKGDDKNCSFFRNKQIFRKKYGVKAHIKKAKKNKEEQKTDHN